MTQYGTDAQWLKEQIARGDAQSTPALMVVEGANSIKTEKLALLMYSLLIERSDFTDEMATEFSNRLGRLPHNRARNRRAS